MTKREFLTTLAVLEAATGHSFTTEQTQAWFVLLQHLTADAMQTAVKRVLMEREYPGLPPVGLIVRYAAEATQGIPLDPEQAFQRVREAITRFGYYQPGDAAKFLGSEVWDVIQGIGGWERICDSPVDQRQSLFAQFRDGWTRQQTRIQDQLRLPSDVRPQQRLTGESPKPHPSIRLLAESLEVKPA